MRLSCGRLQFFLGNSEFVPGQAPLRRLAMAATLALAVLGQTRTATAQMGGYPYPPYAQNDFSMTTEEIPISIAVLSNDYGMFAPLDPTSIHIVSAPSHGVAAVDASTGHVWYFPNTEFWGMDSITYTVSDTLGQTSNVATVVIGVMADTTAPVITSIAVAQGPDGSWTISGTVSDDDPAQVVVYFDGMLAMEHANVNADGTFSLEIYLGPSTVGMFSAQACNAEAYSSLVVYGYINSP